MELAEVERREISEERTRSKVVGNGPQERWKRPAQGQPRKGKGKEYERCGLFRYIYIYIDWGGIATAWRHIRKPGQ